MFLRWIKTPKMNDPQTMLFHHKNRIVVTPDDLAPFLAENIHRNACPPAKRPSHLSGYWLTQTWEFFDCLMFWFGREWINSVLGWVCLVKHFHRGCSRYIILDETSVSNQGSHAQCCSTSALIQGPSLPVAVIESKILCGGNISFCVSEVNNTEIDCVTLGI